VLAGDIADGDSVMLDKGADGLVFRKK
jgi:hypothetical protein